MDRRFGKYEVLGELGSGGMAVVYRARDMLLNRVVALKVMNEKLQGGERARKRFMKEGRAAASLCHPNIVSVYELGVENDLPYIAMEYLSGVDLRGIIEERQPLDLRQKIDMALQVAWALEHAHARGVIHRDIKPGNIRVLDSGPVKLMDFGIAKFTSEEATRLTRTGGVLGTVAYMSPEQLRGDAATAAADIFAFGVLLYELLTYISPFAGPHSPAVIHRILYTEPESIRDPDIPRELEQLILLCLKKRVEDRLGRVGLIVEALEKARREQGSDKGRTPTMRQPRVAAGGTDSSATSQDVTAPENSSRPLARASHDVGVEEPAFAARAAVTRARIGSVAVVSLVLLGAGAWVLRAGPGWLNRPAATPTAIAALNPPPVGTLIQSSLPAVAATQASPVQQVLVSAPSMSLTQPPDASMGSTPESRPNESPAEGASKLPVSGRTPIQQPSEPTGKVTSSLPSSTRAPHQQPSEPGAASSIVSAAQGTPMHAMEASPKPRPTSAPRPSSAPRLLSTPPPALAVPSKTEAIVPFPSEPPRARDVRLGAPEGTQICVDGRPAEATRAGVGWVLKELAIGRRVLRLIHPKLGTAETAIEAEPGSGVQRVLLQDSEWKAPSFRVAFKSAAKGRVPVEGEIGQSYRVEVEPGRVLNVWLGEPEGDLDVAELRIEDSRGITSTSRCARRREGGICDPLPRFECGILD